MNIQNKELGKLIEKWSSLPFSEEEHINSFEEKSAPFIEHIAPKALRFDTINGEAWLKQDMQLIFSRPILWASIHGELIRLMGYDGAKAVLHKAGFEYGFKDAKNYLEYMAKSLDQPTPYFNDILYASMGWGNWQTIKFNLEKGQLQLRSWNRSDISTFVKMYGQIEQPGCLITLGFCNGICSAMYQRKINVIETKCVAKGDKYCEFIAFPEEEFGMVKVTNKLKDTIKKLNQVDGVMASALVSAEGKILASALRANVQEEKVATITATILSVAKQAGIELKQGKFNSIFIDSEEGYIAMTNIGTEAVMVALTSKQTPIGKILLSLKRIAKEISDNNLLKI